MLGKRIKNKIAGTPYERVCIRVGEKVYLMMKDTRIISRLRHVLRGKIYQMDGILKGGDDDIG